MLLAEFPRPQSHNHVEKICFKCKGTGLKPCKEKQANLKLVCTVCRVPVVELVEWEQQRVDLKPSIRIFKIDGKRLGKSSLKPLLNAYDKQDFYALNSFLMLPENNHIMLTALCGDWMIYQFKNGHKITTDDCFIGALVVKHFSILGNIQKPKKYLDLGTGLGSVLQLVTWGLELENNNVIGIEAQKIHVELARKSLFINNCSANIIHADLRELAQYSQKDWSDCDVEFDLITGTPPYFPVKNGPLPKSLNRALCAFEMKGDVSDYLKTASLLLKRSRDASVFIANGGPIQRTIDAGIAVGFKCIARWGLVGIKGKPVLFSVFHFKWKEYILDPLNIQEDINDPETDVVVVRDENGQFTLEYQELVCKWIGKPLPKYEPHSKPKSQSKE